MSDAGLYSITMMTSISRLDSLDERQSGMNIRYYLSVK